MTSFANIFTAVAPSGTHRPLVEGTPEITLRDIDAAHHQRLVSIRHCEMEEIRIALITYRNELRAIWRIAPNWAGADKQYRHLYRYTIRTDVLLAIDEAHARADARHTQADGHRKLMRHLLGV